ncbi:hypothetical protein DXD09_05330 [Ligilactobacillus ruminis]|uniref:Uncharacterized protein n=1 Tax=Ligilactobacillus ruminis TaxID=1623 RepID=A0A8B2YZL8_9LACO|nr:hypothetical protein DXD09_05330 [Ligilactobacillus ruminis]
MPTNSTRATSKVEQNLQKSEKCSTADSKFGTRNLESRTKSPKFGKMFYRCLQIRHARPRK